MLALMIMFNLQTFSKGLLILKHSKSYQFLYFGVVSHYTATSCSFFLIQLANLPKLIYPRVLTSYIQDTITLYCLSSIWCVSPKACWSAPELDSLRFTGFNDRGQCVTPIETRVSNSLMASLITTQYYK